MLRACTGLLEVDELKKHPLGLTQSLEITYFGNPIPLVCIFDLVGDGGLLFCLRGKRDKLVKWR